MTLTIDEYSLVEQRVANESQSTALAYVLWFFTWFVSGHRWYLGRQGSAILQIASYFVLVGFVWVIIDAFLIPGMVRENRDAVRQRTVAALEQKKAKDTEVALANAPSLRACPACAEQIQAAAIKCRYCGSDVVPAEPAAA